MSASRPRLEDLSIIVSGQGGDGSLTVINILADALRSVGFRAYTCLLYTSPSPRDVEESRMPSSA